MELWQIMAIVIGSLYLIVFFIFIGMYVRTQKRDKQRNEQLVKMYADPNLKIMDYDFVPFGDEIEDAILQKRMSQNLSNNADDQQLTFLGSVDNEGIEEITGNYKP